MKTNNQKFIYYQPKHFEQLLKLSIKFTYEHDLEQDSKSASEKEKIEKKQRKYLKKNANSKYYRYYLCLINKKLVGYIWFGQQDSDRSKGFIDQLYVKPKYRKKGIATILLREAIRWTKEKDCSLVELDVKVSNKNAIRLYQEMGFSKQKPKWINFSMDFAE